MKKYFILLTLAFGMLLNAETVLESDFTQMEKLTGWVDMAKKVPDEKNFFIVTENGETFLRTSGPFGISARLSKRIVVDDSTAQVKLTMIARKPKADAQLFAFALTSREFPEGGAGGAFGKGRDSGFLMQGYHYSNHAANFIAWRKDGGQVQMSMPKQPFVLIPAVFGEWLTLSLVYDHIEKQLLFYNGTSNEPVLTQYNADLAGVPLDSVWLRPGIEFKKVTVEVIKK